MWHLWGTRKVHSGFWWEELREGDKWEDLGLDARIILKWLSKK
jgi:hypothetical protein